MHTYIWSVRENKLTWLGYALLGVGVCAWWYEGWATAAVPFPFVVCFFAGFFLVAWTALSTYEGFRKAYDGIRQREGKIDEDYVDFWRGMLPCYTAGFRVAVRKWNRKHPAAAIDLSTFVDQKDSD